MKIIEVKTLAIPSLKIVRFARFRDHRGYFTEQYRRSDLANYPAGTSLNDFQCVQCNESYSRQGTVRGLHFQWNPYMGKLVRTLTGSMLDLVLDIRLGSPTFGKIVVYEMPADPDAEAQEWIWVPPGFAHGNAFSENTTIEYLCSGEYSQGCEAGISPLAGDIDWTLCDPVLKGRFDKIAGGACLITDKDRNGFTLKQWLSDPRSANFTIENLP